MKNVVVAGGTTGMGREIALHYLRRGARVTVIGSTPARGEEFLRAAEPLDGEAAFVRADLLSIEGAEDFGPDHTTRAIMAAGGRR